MKPTITQEHINAAQRLADIYGKALIGIRRENETMAGGDIVVQPAIPTRETWVRGCYVENTATIDEAGNMSLRHADQVIIEPAPGFHNPDEATDETL